jgi:hypothetical protein
MVRRRSDVEPFTRSRAHLSASSQRSRLTPLCELPTHIELRSTPYPAERCDRIATVPGVPAAISLAVLRRVGTPYVVRRRRTPNSVNHLQLIIRGNSRQRAMQGACKAKQPFPEVRKALAALAGSATLAALAALAALAWFGKLCKGKLSWICKASPSHLRHFNFSRLVLRSCRQHPPPPR